MVESETPHRMFSQHDRGNKKTLPYGVPAIEQYQIEYTYRQKKGKEFLKFLALFLDKHCFCVHGSYFDFIDMPSLRSARYICLQQIRYVFAALKLDMI